MGDQFRRSARILPGAVLIALGLALLAGNILSFDVLETLWPVILIALGLVWVIRGPLWLGVVSVVAGTIFLADNLGAGSGHADVLAAPDRGCRRYLAASTERSDADKSHLHVREPRGPDRR